MTTINVIIVIVVLFALAFIWFCSGRESIDRKKMETGQNPRTED